MPDTDNATPTPEPEALSAHACNEVGVFARAMRRAWRSGVEWSPVWSRPQPSPARPSPAGPIRALFQSGPIQPSPAQPSPAQLLMRVCLLSDSSNPPHLPTAALAARAAMASHIARRALVATIVATVSTHHVSTHHVSTHHRQHAPRQPSPTSSPAQSKRTDSAPAQSDARTRLQPSQTALRCDLSLARAVGALLLSTTSGRRSESRAHRRLACHACTARPAGACTSTSTSTSTSTCACACACT